jgi:hypothetical protein
VVGLKPEVTILSLSGAKALGCGLQHTTSDRQHRGIGAIKSVCQDEIGWIGLLFSKLRGRANANSGFERGNG